MNESAATAEAATPPTDASAHAPAEGHAAYAHGHGHHVSSFSSLVGIWIALMVLTLLTVQAYYYNFGEWDVAVAMLIATIKAALVMLYFMHLRWDKPFNFLVFISSFAFAGLFISFALLDSDQYQPQVQQATDDIMRLEAAQAAQAAEGMEAEGEQAGAEEGKAEEAEKQPADEEAKEQESEEAEK